MKPMTRLGRWAVALAVVSGLAWLVGLPAFLLAPTEGVWWPWGVWLLVTLVPALTCGIAASIVAFLAMIRRGERALSVYLGYVPVVSIVLSSVLSSIFSD
jgi:hypothetical protein